LHPERQRHCSVSTSTSTRERCLSRSHAYRPSSYARNAASLQILSSALEDPLCPTNEEKCPTRISPAHNQVVGARWTSGSGHRTGKLGATTIHAAPVCPQSSTYHATQAREKSTLGRSTGLLDLERTCHGHTSTEHAKIAGLRGVDPVGTPVPPELISHTLGDCQGYS
jgi:hypothetical protein